MSNYILKRTTPNTVMFFLSPVSDSQQKKLITLSDKMPSVALPEDWALGVFFDSGVYTLYRGGYITFDDNDAAVASAYKAGVYFDDKLDFTPSNEKTVDEVLAVLKGGVRSKITNAIETYGKEFVESVAVKNIDSLTNGVIRMLEDLLNIQLTLNIDE